MSERTTKTVIGFDIRRHPQRYVPRLWDAGRRDSFLLAPETQWPLSVDTLVWPSVFAPNRTLSEEYKQLTGLESAIEVKDLSFVDEFWINLDRMRHSYERSARTDLNAVEVAIRIVRDAKSAPADTEIEWLFENSVSPSEVSEGRSLGYDIADAALISGLSNCGYEPSEKDVLQPTWSSKLNEYGLFRELEDAGQFKVLSDKRVPEHAPFAVFELLLFSPESL